MIIITMIMITTTMIMTNSIYDLFIIGGGINGVAIARDAAGRGLSVMLCEQDDLASGTSSASTKLIHGGLRYLEQYEFRLVRNALQEREILLKNAPHLIRPQEFVIPHATHLRPAWLMQIGLFLYDHLSQRKLLAKSQRISLNNNLRAEPLLSSFHTAFTYADCWVDDARLVVLNAVSARELGATIVTRTRCESAIQENGLWKLQLVNSLTQQRSEVFAKVLVNATGPWIDQVLQHVIHAQTSTHTVLSKGSHIIVPKLYQGAHAYLLQNPDGRIVFTIPYENNFTLIGTTDMSYQGDPHHAEISDDEKDYLCKSVAHYFKNPPGLKDIVWCYAGVRPLVNDGEKKLSAVTREYVLNLIKAPDKAPLLNIFGGKLTSHRTLAEAALKKIAEFFPQIKSAWTQHAPLPGGDLPQQNFEAFYQEFQKAYAWLPAYISLRLAHQYGTRAHQILNHAKNLNDLGEDFGAGLYQCEVKYMIKYEWAITADDILWRRSKLGLHCADDTRQKLKQYLGTNSQ